MIGDFGFPGPVGEPGESKFGIKGVTGDDGEVGERGPPGKLIENGHPEVVGSPSATYYRGPTGQPGPHGDAGDRGLKGETGSRGPPVSICLFNVFSFITFIQFTLWENKFYSKTVFTINL